MRMTSCSKQAFDLNPLTCHFYLWLLTFLVYSMNKMGPRLQRICSQQWSYIEIDIWPEQKTYFKVKWLHVIYSIERNLLQTRILFTIYLFDLDFWCTKLVLGHCTLFIHSHLWVDLSQRGEKICSKNDLLTSGIGQDWTLLGNHRMRP